MNEWVITLTPVFLLGIVLGLVYFFGLWTTVQRLPYVHHPALWAVLSFVLRNLVVFAGLFLVVEGQWQRVAACLAGFLLIRLVFVKNALSKLVSVMSVRGEN